MSPWSVVRDGSRLVRRFVRMHPVAFAVAVTGSAAFAAAIIASALVVGWVTDEVVIPVLSGGEGRDLLPVAAAAIVGVAVFKAVGIVVRRTAARWLELRTQLDVRNELLAHQISLRMSWFERQAIGDLLAVADSDVNQGTGALGPLPYATGVSLLLVGTVVMIALLDPWLGLGALVGLAVAIAIDVHGSWVTYAMWEEVQRRRGKVSSVAHESFDGALTVKALGREGLVTERFQQASNDLRDRVIEVNATWTKYQVVIRALPQALILVLIVVGAARIGAGALTPGDVVTVAYLLSLLAFPIQLIGFVLWELAGGLAGWQRVQAVLDADEFMSYGDLSATARRAPAPVEGRGLEFSYRAGPVLSAVDLDISAGTTVAVVGPTGSGKSTLALMLARLWDPDSGEIRLEGRDLRSFARSELPKEVAYVAQDAFLFDATVRDNITLGAEFSDVEIEQALELAGASFVSDLSAGLDTELGERGTTLSGGQRQRLALARALIRKPRLLVLDDATSAVDPSVEAGILARLKDAALPSTVVVVAYRPASIRLADEVIYVDDHTVAGHGNHAELIRTAPGYATLVQAYEEEALRLRKEAS